MRYCWIFILFVVQVQAQVTLPVDFESSAASYFVDFEGNASAVVADPTNPSNMVAISTKTVASQAWAGTTIGDPAFSSPIPFSASDTEISLRVYSAYPGTPIHLKAEDLDDTSIFVETRMYTTKANEWETIVFDFADPIFESPILNLGVSYSKLSVFFDFGTPGSEAGAQDFYWDDVIMGGTSTTLDMLDLPVTFELPGISYALVDFENNSSVLGTDPTGASGTVAITTKPANASPWSGTIVGTRNGFVNPIPFTPNAAKVRMRVYSPAANTPILLKAEVSSNPGIYVETLQFTTTANEWETIEWNFLQQQPNTPSLDFTVNYDLLAIFFNFGIEGAATGETVYYWDDVEFIFNTSQNDLETIEFSAYPNPVVDVLNLELEENILSIQFFNTLGQEVYAEEVKNDKKQFDLSHLSSGTYFLRMTTNEGEGYRTILKR